MHFSGLWEILQDLSETTGVGGEERSNANRAAPAPTAVGAPPPIPVVVQPGLNNPAKAAGVEAESDMHAGQRGKWHCLVSTCLRENGNKAEV